MTLFNRKGQVIIISSIIICLVFSIFVFTLYFIFKTGTTASLHDKLADRAIEISDVGISQMISDIHRRAVDIDLVPITKSYAIAKYSDSSESEQVDVTLKLVPDTHDVDSDGDTTEPETDLEGNKVYQIESSSWGSLVGGVKITKRKVAARISIVDLARYGVFYVEDDSWNVYSDLTSGDPLILTGRYHTNGNLRLGGVIYFNNQYLPMASGSNNLPGPTLNTDYNPAYTVMCANQIKQETSPPIWTNITYTQNNDSGKLSADKAFSVCPTATMPRGTWFDQSHGGYKIHLEPLDFVKYQSMAQVIIDREDLPNFKVFGTNYSSNDLLIDNGAGEQVVDIDLAFLGSGTSQDICQGMTNYENALNSQNGLVVFVKGPVGVHGKLAECAAFPNNKKVTIVTTDSVDILGDILFSQDPYFQILDSCNKTDGWSYTVDTDPSKTKVQKMEIVKISDEFSDPTWIDGKSKFWYKNIDDKALHLRIKAVAGGQVTLKKHFKIESSPAGVANSCICVHFRQKHFANGDVDAYFQIKDKDGNVIDTTSDKPGHSDAVHLDNSGQFRSMMVRDRPRDELSWTNIKDFNDNGGDNLEIIFFNFQSDDTYDLYIDELNFNFGQSYPVDQTTTNPTNDAIAIIAQGNIYENGNYLYEYKASSPPDFGANVIYVPARIYFAGATGFKINTEYYYDFRIDAFLYTALDGSQYTSHTPQFVDLITNYGTIISHLAGMAQSSTMKTVQDRNLPGNISKAVPIGTVIHTYQQLH